MEIYQTLRILLSERDLDTFQGRMTNFLDLWESKEPDFVKYFKGHYEGEAGTISQSLLITKIRSLCILQTYTTLLFQQRSGHCVTGISNMETLIPTCTSRGKNEVLITTLLPKVVKCWNVPFIM